MNDSKCIICFNSGQAKYCTHAYCVACLRKYCERQLNQKRKCSCAIPGCKSYSPSELKEILDEKSYSCYSSQIDENAIQDYLNRHGQQCTQCQEWVTKGEGCNRVNCRCGLSWDWRYGPPQFVPPSSPSSSSTSPSFWCLRWFRDETKIFLNQLSPQTLILIELELTKSYSASKEMSIRNIRNHLKKL